MAGLYSVPAPRRRFASTSGTALRTVYCRGAPAASNATRSPGARCVAEYGRSTETGSAGA